MIAAIDGPAGVGKSTVSRTCAQRLGFLYLNSGNLYRAVTRLHLDAGRDPHDEAHVLATATEASISLSGSRIIANGRDITDSLHTDDVDSFVAQHSAIVPVRHLVNDLIRRAVSGLDVIVEGRDITTVVFPDAPAKIYLDASIEVRARRRFEQRTSTLSLEELRRNIAMRDEIDSNKQEGSLKISSDAFYIDTSRLTIEEVCERVIGFIRNTASA
jgi:CMP/dCMP kinase